MAEHKIIIRREDLDKIGKSKKAGAPRIKEIAGSKMVFLEYETKEERD